MPQNVLQYLQNSVSLFPTTVTMYQYDLLKISVFSILSLPNRVAKINYLKIHGKLGILDGLKYLRKFSHLPATWPYDSLKLIKIGIIGMSFRCDDNIFCGNNWLIFKMLLHIIIFNPLIIWMYKSFPFLEFQQWYIPIKGMQCKSPHLQLWKLRSLGANSLAQGYRVNKSWGTSYWKRLRFFPHHAA